MSFKVKKAREADLGVSHDIGVGSGPPGGLREMYGCATMSLSTSRVRVFWTSLTVLPVFSDPLSGCCLVFPGHCSIILTISSICTPSSKLIKLQTILNTKSSILVHY